MFAKLVAAAGLTMLAAAVLIAPATAGESPYVDEVTVIDCTSSGRGPGTLVIVPVGAAAEGVTYAIEVDTANGLLTARRTILVLEGETFRVTADGAVVASGVGHAPGSAFCGVTPPPPPPPPPSTTTTVVCEGQCSQVTTTTLPDVTTTMLPDVTTTTRPNEPTDDGDCPPGATMDPTGVCFADVEGG